MEYQKLFRRCDSLDGDTLAKAETELRETPEMKIERLQALRDLIDTHVASGCSQKKHVAKQFVDQNDDILLRFLRVKKYDVNKTFKSMENNIKFRDKHPTLTSGLTLNSVRKTLERGYPRVLPARDREGRVVFIFSIGSWRASEVPFDDVMRAYVYLFEKLMQNIENQVSGFVLIENFRNYSIAQALSLKPAELQKMVDMIQGAFPIRFKGVHVLHQPWYFTWTWAVVRPFLKAKMVDRVHIHGWNLQKFLAQFDPTTLPTDVGGSGPELSPLELIRSLEYQENSTTG